MHHFVVKFLKFTSPQAARGHDPRNQNPADVPEMVAAPPTRPASYAAQSSRPVNESSVWRSKNLYETIASAHHSLMLQVIATNDVA